MKRLTTDIFIQKARVVHGDRYDYSNTVYSNDKTPLNITCPIHGVFTQLASNHFAGKGCKHCAGNQHLSPTITIQKLNTIHNHKYTYNTSTFINNKQNISIKCPIHNWFTLSFLHHKRGAGCPQCTEHYHHAAGTYFETRARKIHGTKYHYGIYTKAITKMDITCPIHGLFQQVPSSHLQGHGCPQCSNDRKKILAKGGYTDEFFILHPDMKLHPGFFYVVEFSRDKETFLKIGITRTNIKSRFKSGYKKYSYFSLLEKSLPLYEAFCLEKTILDNFKQFKVFPKQHNFVGKTECLSSTCTRNILEFVISNEIEAHD